MDGYTIDQASARMGVSKHTLRYYEREGLLEPVAKEANGHRRYTDEDLGWVRTLQLLRGTGMPIREMKEFVELSRAGDLTVPQRIEVLAHYRDELLDRMAADRERLEFLDFKLEVYRGIEGDPDARTRAEVAQAEG
ncbi:MerR family transcriptional regulator [Demequina zhanjiangensis]|uniref:MerR family transcriptional regulator n=1 Tax=Demequina zhanjiangensis TaxID=3051659 RepID=A0ABT8G486_9MICO|nr:MerR family transcriptional regulator [Demequina sp. SYSU T00b26]MDN4473960.1 MerR family transcriptional regulator [Demequina sp. SYSU T00b26]